MNAIHLLRCKAEQLPQGDAFAQDMTAQEVIEKSFLARPTSKVKRGSVWHIGNSSQTKNSGLAFALGRDAILKAPEFDEKLREFREVEQKHAPFTVGVFDPKDQTIGVLVRQGVSLNAQEVASKLEVLLESAGIARMANRKISVDFIPDPTGFIEAINSSHRISRFEFSFTLPNPPDDEKYIQRPLKDFAKKSGAEEGKASVTGKSLDKDTIVEVASAIAASGDDATANLQMTPRGAVIRKRLRLDAVKELFEVSEDESLSQAILSAMRRAYSKVRTPPSRNASDE